MNFLPFSRSILALCLVGSMAASAQTPLSVTQGRAAQRAGTQLVDVYYDVSGGTAPYTVTLQGSADGGATWTLPVTTVSGNVGVVAAAGANRIVTWNAGADWAGELSTNVKFRVNVAGAATLPAPDGFALIPAGSFTMGDSTGAVGYGYELPLHSVYVSAFYMEKYEVTKELWDSVRAWGLGNGYHLPVGNEGYASKGTNHPVHTIDWDSMLRWCNARSQRDGLTPCYTMRGATYKNYDEGDNYADLACNWRASGYRLPTEAEWEKAARGGLSGQNFPRGNTISHSQANYYVYRALETNLYSYDVSPTPYYHPTYAVGSYPYSSPVGSFAPNGYGLHDMAGNMWEWCWDWYGSYTADAQTDPSGSPDGPVRVFRGGSWLAPAAYSCVAARFPGYPTSPATLGFRVARSSVP